MKFRLIHIASVLSAALMSACVPYYYPVDYGYSPRGRGHYAYRHPPGHHHHHSGYGHRYDYDPHW